MSARRFGLTVFVGYLLAQALWVLAVPPFRGIDEFDHAFRAAGVAAGEWKVTQTAEDGRGMVVTVPRSLVSAASAQCEWLPYTGDDNCRPIDDRGPGEVTVATSAGLYNPVWYAVIGTPTLLLDGSVALYALRALTAVVCALGVGAAAWAVAIAGAGPWTRFGLLAALSPVLVYSTVIPGPNGPEIVAGLLLWTALLALFVPVGPHPRRHGVLLALATLAGVTLATLRSIGPMWLGLIVLSVLATVGPRVIGAELARHPLKWLAASGVVVTAVVAGVWWTLDAGLTNTSPDILATGPDDDFTLGSKPLAWTLQMLAAFPLRRDFAPPGVYMCGALVIGFLLVAAVVRAPRRQRLVLIGLLALTIGLPIIMTLLTVESQGAIWQGRYQLPWATGILVLSGLQLDRTDLLRREGNRPVLLGGALLAVAQGVSVWGVSHRETMHVVSSVDSSWMTLPPLVLGGLTSIIWLGLVVMTGPREGAIASVDESCFTPVADRAGSPDEARRR